MQTSAARLCRTFIAILCLCASCQDPSRHGSPQATTADDSLTICSFNIKFLGSSKERDCRALTSILKDYDIVLVQELVAPPYAGSFPDNTPYKPDPESAAFFDQMAALGFAYVLSEEDTGTGSQIHTNGTSTEWWVMFYKPGRVQVASDLPHGFLAEDRANCIDYERVPYAFAVRSGNARMDFVLISVHLKPDADSQSRLRRRHELSTIADWVAAHAQKEKDFIIVGDMNIQDSAELRAATPPGFQSLNAACTPTNVTRSRPYDHVMFVPQYTTEIDTVFGFKVVDLIHEMKPLWTHPTPFPASTTEFQKYFSDHDPVVFRLTAPAKDDD